MSTPDDDPIDGWLRSALAPPVEEPTEAGAYDPIDDGLLQALRRGELADVDAEAIEQRLAGDREARLLAAAHTEVLDAPTPLWAAAALPRGTRRPIWHFALAATVLLGVGIGLWQAQQAVEIPAYGLTAIEGQVQTVRADPEAPSAGRPVFTPDSRIILSFAPPSAVDEVPPVAVFAPDAAGHLKRLPAQVAVAGGGGLTVMLGAADAFGQRFGDHRLYVAFGPSDDADGRPWPAAEATEAGTGWLTVELTYAAEGPDGARP